MPNTRHTQFYMGKEYPNFGGGGAGGSFNVTSLFTNTQHANLTAITLSESLENYDLVELIIEDRTYENYTSFVYDTDYMINEFPYISDNPSGVFSHAFLLGYDNHYMRLTMGQTNDKLVIPTDKNTLMIYEVRGIKCGGGSGGGGGGSIDYSTTEQDTGQKWIDGKTIYQRTYSFESVIRMVAGQWTSVNEIDTSTMSTIISCDGIGEDGTYWQTLSVRIVNGGGIFNSRSGDVYIKYVTLRYTKASS